MIALACVAGYFVIGWIWASLVVYFNWRCDETWTEFKPSFFLWWLDMIRRIFHGFGNLLDMYEGWLNRLRKGNDR